MEDGRNRPVTLVFCAITVILAIGGAIDDLQVPLLRGRIPGL